MKEKIYLKALANVGLVDIDLDVIKKDIFKGIDYQYDGIYLFTINFFTADSIARPLIRREEIPFLDGSYDEDDFEDMLYDILDAVNHLSDRPIYAITKQQFDQNGNFVDDDDREIYAIRDGKGDIIKEFIIKF